MESFLKLGQCDMEFNINRIHDRKIMDRQMHKFETQWWKVPRGSKTRFHYRLRKAERSTDWMFKT